MTNFKEEIEHLKRELKRKINNMKTSKVKAVQANGTYESKFGLLYKYEYTMEDGTTLTANHKTEGGNFQVGEDVEYEVKGTNDYGSWGKVTRPSEDNYQAKTNAPMSDERQYMIVLQSCLKASATYYAERTDGSPEVVMEQAKIWANEILG